MLDKEEEAPQSCCQRPFSKETSLQGFGGVVQGEAAAICCSSMIRESPVQQVTAPEADPDEGKGGCSCCVNEDLAQVTNKVNRCAKTCCDSQAPMENDGGCYRCSGDETKDNKDIKELCAKNCCSSQPPIKQDFTPSCCASVNTEKNCKEKCLAEKCNGLGRASAKQSTGYGGLDRNLNETNNYSCNGEPMDRASMAISDSAIGSNNVTCSSSIRQMSIGITKGCSASQNCCSSRDNVESADETDEEDDNTLCPCCVQEVIKNPTSVTEKRRLMAASRRLPASGGSLNLLEEKLRSCCRLMKDVCLQKSCCFAVNVPRKKKERQRICVVEDQPAPTTEVKISNSENVIRSSSTSSSTNEQYLLTIGIIGMDCADCCDKVHKALSRLPSVQTVAFSYLNSVATLTHDPETISSDAICRFVARATGFKIKSVNSTDKNPKNSEFSGNAVITDRTTLPVKFGTTPPSEVLDSLNILRDPDRKGNSYYDISFSAQSNSRRPALQARDILGQLSVYQPRLVPVSELDNEDSNRVRADLHRVGRKTLASSLLSIPVLVLAWAPLNRSGNREVVYGSVSIGLTTLILIVGFPIISGSARSIIYLRQPDLGFLASIGILVAYIFSIVAFAFSSAGKPFTEPFFETTALLVSLIYIGRLVSALSRRTAGSAVRELQKLQPQWVTLLETNGKDVVETKLDARLLHYGDVVQVTSDMRVPTDGIVVNGEGEIDESSATGESLPIVKRVGSKVLAGTLNLNGILEIQVTHLVFENSLSSMASLVKEAQSSKSQLQDFADRFSAIILPIATATAIVTFLVQILVNYFVRKRSVSASAVSAITFSLSVMIVSCPCAIGLAIPLVVASAVRAGIRHGILFRSAAALQTAHTIDVVAFDKTGTLTDGSFSLQFSEFLAASVQSLIRQLTATSAHPISKAIQLHLQSLSSDASTVKKDQMITDTTSLPGMGIQALFAGYSLLGGSPIFTGVVNHPTIVDLTSSGLTLFTVTLGGELIAVFGLVDRARPESALLVQELVGRGKRVVILSGDNIAAVKRIAGNVGVQEVDVHASCSPARKAQLIAEMQREGHRVAFVGDGTNDGGALAQADLALSIGVGSEVAIAASEAIVLGDNLHRSVLGGLDIAAQAQKHIFASLVWCGIYFVFAILLAAGAFVKFRLSPQWAGLGEVISILPVILIGVSLDLRWR